MSVAVYLMDFAKWMKNTTAVGVIKISYAALKRYGMFFVIQVPHVPQLNLHARKNVLIKLVRDCVISALVAHIVPVDVVSIFN